jgi:sugar fermentation stimulation protein A
MVEIGGRLERAHINNTGKLLDVLVSGRRGFCHPLPEGRKLRYRLFSVWYNGGFSVIDTNLQEKAFAIAVSRGLLPWASDCVVVRRSPRVGRHRLDYLLECAGDSVIVETKSAVLLDTDGYALYPDTPSSRGRSHIALLSELARRGMRVWLVFIAAFPGAKGFRPNGRVDPVLPGLVADAVRAGVLVRSIGLEYDPGRRGIILYNPSLPIDLSA